MEDLKTPAKAGFSFSRWILAFAAMFVALRLLRARHAIDFRGRVVIITGGSRGLGLNIARELAAQGAKIVLVARKADELERATRELQALGAQVETVVADVTTEQGVQDAIRATIKRFNHLDALINNAGIIQVGPFEHMKDEDFADAIDLHIWAPLRLSRAAAPYLKRSGVGRIVNIASVGGLIAVPHMAPYAASKFGMVGLSDALRHELAKEGVRVTTVCPGLIRTGSHLAAKFKGQHEREYKLFKLGASLPGAIEAPTAARRIVEAMKYGDPFLTFPEPIGLAAIAYRVFPNLSAELLSLLARFMPAPTGMPDGDEIRAGGELDSKAGDVPMAKFADRAALAHNELNGHAMEKRA